MEDAKRILDLDDKIAYCKNEMEKLEDEQMELLIGMTSLQDPSLVFKNCVSSPIKKCVTDNSGSDNCIYCQETP